MAKKTPAKRLPPTKKATEATLTQQIAMLLKAPGGAERLAELLQQGQAAFSAANAADTGVAASEASEPPERPSTRGRKAEHKVEDFCSPEEIRALPREKLQAKARSRANRPIESFRVFLKERGLTEASMKVADDRYGKAALIEESAESWWLVYATYDETRLARRMEIHFTGPLAAKESSEKYREFSKANDEGHLFSSLEFYRPLAMQMLKRTSIDAAVAHKIPRRIGFVLAYYCEKNGWDKNFKDCRRVLEKVKNNPLIVTRPGESPIRENWVRPLLEELALLERERDGRTHAKSGHFSKLASTLKQSFVLAHSAFGRFIDHLDLAVAFESEASDIRSRLLDEDNFPALPLKDVETLLALALERDRALYFFILLQLSTCLRNVEMERLSKKYLINDGRNLLYCDKENDVYLVQKTRGKVDYRQDLSDPPTSIVTRVILKHFQFEIPQMHADFFAKNGEVRLALTEPGGHQRSLRTTGATMLRFGLETLVARIIDPKYIMQRMAHKDETMIATVYAKNLPPDARGLRPDKYFKITHIEINVDGKTHVIGPDEFAWDLWLLTHFLTMMNASMTAAEFDQLQRWVAQEITHDDIGEVASLKFARR